MINVIAPRKVQISRLGVELFNARWPCSPLSIERSYWFEFDEDGNLVDTDVPEHSDGDAAAALAADALDYLTEDNLPVWYPKSLYDRHRDLADL